MHDTGNSQCLPGKLLGRYFMFPAGLIQKCRTERWKSAEITFYASLHHSIIFQERFPWKPCSKQRSHFVYPPIWSQYPGSVHPFHDVMAPQPPQSVTWRPRGRRGSVGKAEKPKGRRRGGPWRQSCARNREMRCCNKGWVVQRLRAVDYTGSWLWLLVLS